MAIKGRKIPLERGSEKSSEKEIEKERERETSVIPRVVFSKNK